jgi:hypothetical protein
LARVAISNVIEGYANTHLKYEELGAQPSSNDDTLRVLQAPTDKELAWVHKYDDLNFQFIGNTDKLLTVRHKISWFTQIS